MHLPAHFGRPHGNVAGARGHLTAHNFPIGVQLKRHDPSDVLDRPQQFDHPVLVSSKTGYGFQGPLFEYRLLFMASAFAKFDAGGTRVQG